MPICIIVRFLSVCKSKWQFLGWGPYGCGQWHNDNASMAEWQYGNITKWQNGFELQYLWPGALWFIF
jgi:hypothetical protein